MANTKRWIASHFNLYRWTEDGLYWLPRVGITSIIWEKNNNNECPYCGSVMTNDVCKGCQNTSFSAAIGSAEVTFTSILPDAIEHIFDLPTGTVIDAVYIWAGDCANGYENHNGGLRFKVSHIVRRVIPHLVAMCPSDDDVIHFHTIAQCKVELLFNQAEE